MNKTLEYYNENADMYSNTTVNVDFSKNQEIFLSFLEPNAYILDFGCGSGRDTKYFLNKGYKVDAIDGSKELCILASKYTGIHVKNMLFQNLNENNIYDGIWACSSILHLNKEELKDVIQKMIIALKDKGIIYTCFKYGDFEGYRDKRYFIDFTEESVIKFFNEFSNLSIESMWITGDSIGRKEQRWLNLILKKQM